MRVRYIPEYVVEWLTIEPGPDGVRTASTAPTRDVWTVEAAVKFLRRSKGVFSVHQFSRVVRQERPWWRPWWETTGISGWEEVDSFDVKPYSR